eukprot:TRINITY_DN2288_c0_g1_i1.p1 TRINITY_DN2288_c0_g1~~TRINITY_DN2288_c0_g1_i1.p1  ORF type:complete len:710 (-),score=74.71 TRINITY_DN2288_c0_g1_i1:403-2532(-)
MQVDQKLQKYTKKIKPSLNPNSKAQIFHQSTVTLSQKVPLQGNQNVQNVQHLEQQKPNIIQQKTFKQNTQQLKRKKQSEIPMVIADPLAANLPSGDIRMRTIRTSWALVGGKSSRPLSVPLPRLGAKDLQGREKRCGKRQKEAEENHLRRMGQLRQKKEPQNKIETEQSKKIVKEKCPQIQQDGFFNDQEDKQTAKESSAQCENIVKLQDTDYAEQNANGNDDDNRINNNSNDNSGFDKQNQENSQNNKSIKKRERTIEDVQQEQITKQVKLLQHGFEERMNRNFGLNIKQLQNVSVDQLPTFNEGYERIESNNQKEYQQQHINSFEHDEVQSELQRSQQATHDSNSPQKVCTPEADKMAQQQYQQYEQSIVQLMYQMEGDNKVDQWLNSNWPYLKPDTMPIEYVELLMIENDFDIESRSIQLSPHSKQQQKQIDWNLFIGKDLIKENTKNQQMFQQTFKNDHNQTEKRCELELDWSLSLLSEDGKENRASRKEKDGILSEQDRDKFEINNQIIRNWVVPTKADENFDSKRQSKGQQCVSFQQDLNQVNENWRLEIDEISLQQDTDKLDGIDLDSNLTLRKQENPLKRINMTKILQNQSQKQSSILEQSIDLSCIVDEIVGGHDKQAFQNNNIERGVIPSLVLSPTFCKRDEISSFSDLQNSVNRTLQLSLSSPVKFNKKYLMEKLSFCSDFISSQNNQKETIFDELNV